MNTFGKAPTWGSAWKAFIKENADRTNTAYLQKTTLPYEDNYLDLDPVVKDPLGLPVCRITADYKDNERKLAAFIQDKMEEWYRAAGAIEILRGPVGVDGHRRRTRTAARAWATTPTTNVVDRWGFSHEAPNLGDSRRVGDGDERRAKSDADGAGARLADGRASGEQLEDDCRVKARPPCPAFLCEWRALTESDHDHAKARCVARPR